MATATSAGDHLERARLLVLLLLGAAALALAISLLKAGPQPSTSSTAALVRLLRLDSLSLIPSGRTGRGPVPAHPALDPRQSPLLPRWDGLCRGALLLPCADGSGALSRRGTAQ